MPLDVLKQGWRVKYQPLMDRSIPLPEEWGCWMAFFHSPYRYSESAYGSLCRSTGKCRETQGARTGLLGVAIPHVLMWKAFDISYRDLVYWLACSTCPEFYKPPNLDGNIYPEKWIPSQYLLRGRIKEAIGNFTIYLREVNISLLKMRYLFGRKTDLPCISL